jgi:PAS domain S-box-containing protein
MQETVASTVVLFSAVTGLCLLLSVVLSSTFFSSRVLKPVQRASESVGDIARGRLSRRVEAAADDEIGDLARGLNVMAERLESRDASLREAEARYRSMVENAMEGIFRTSLDGEILRVNPALARILGYESEEALLRVGDVGWLYAEPDQRRRILNRLLQHGTVEFEEIQGRREDGNPFWVELNCRLARDESGEPRWIDGFVQDISERKAREEAERELQAAEAASRAKSMFLANMSHEIRTPMNIILGATDMLEQSALTGDQRGCVRLLRESGGALLGLISDVLDLSKIEAGKIELQEVDFDLPDLVAQTAGIFSAQAADKGLELSWGCAPELPQVVRGDPNRLRQVLTNLLGNAVKFTSQGEVRLEASLANPPGEETEAVEVLFMVSDTGPGVEPGQRSAIFETFTQADASTSREHGGAGLGLAITRSLVELMGGSVWCESRAERGSVFWVSLPFAPAEGPPAATEAQQIAPADLPPASVLMVEDNELNRMLFEYYLESTPCTAAFAENGEQGVEAFRAGRFDIVFMDVSMPVMDGLEAARAIREIERDRGEEPTPIVALTAHGLAGDEQRCLEAGCTLYLAKPVRQRDVLRCIRDDAVVRGTAGGGED